MEDNVEMILKCVATVAAGLVQWKLLTPDVFKWESKITLKRGNATKTYSVHAGVDTESENDPDKNKTKEVQKIGSTTGVRPRSEAMREQTLPTTELT